jgi:hypothetical protein
VNERESPHPICRYFRYRFRVSLRLRVLASRFFRFRGSDQYQNFSGAAVGEIAAIAAHAVFKWQEARKPIAFPSQFSLEQRQEQ